MSSGRETRRRREPAVWRSELPLSRLDAFCRQHGIATPRLADAAQMSRQQTARIRAGRAEPTLRKAKALAKGASAIVGRNVAVGELFDLDVHTESVSRQGSDRR